MIPLPLYVSIKLKGDDEMTATTLILDGNQVATRIKESLIGRINHLSDKGIVPCLATILVGDDPSSATYVRMKGNACKRLRIQSIRIDLPKNTSTDELIEVINQLNADTNVHGILL